MFRFALRYRDGDDAGLMVTAEPKWEIGMDFWTGDHRHLRIVDIVEVPPDSPVLGVWVVVDAG